MNNLIYPCIILKGKAAEAADYYMNTFGDGRITQTSPYVVQIALGGQKIMLLDEGPDCTPNPSISFMVISPDEAETEKYWNAMIDTSTVMMPLGNYPWSKKYGWLSDKYGVSWQLYTGAKQNDGQKIIPTMMYTGAVAGKTTEAINLYTGLFPDSKIYGIMNYGEGEGDRTDFVKHAQFEINGFTMAAMDSSAAHKFEFNDAVSLCVECEDQAEVDKFWDALIADGGKEVMCGWLVDKYGIRWQIIPKRLMQLLKDPKRAQRVMGAVMKMKKLVIADLENA